MSQSHSPDRRTNRRSEAQTLGGHTGTVRVLSAADRTLATFGDDRTIRFWSAGGGNPRRMDGHTRSRHHVLHLDGKTVAFSVLTRPGFLPVNFCQR